MGMGEGQCPHVPLYPHVPYATLYPQYPRGSPCPYLAPFFPMSPHTAIPLRIPRVSRSPPSASVSASGQHRMWLWGSCSPPWQSSMTTTSQVGGASMGGARGGGRVCSDPAFCPTQLGAAPSSTAPPAGAALWPPSAPRKSANAHKVGPMSPRPRGPPHPRDPPTFWTSSPYSPGDPHTGFPLHTLLWGSREQLGFGGVMVGFRRHRGNGGTWGPGKWRNTWTWRTRRELESRYRGAGGG